MSLFSRCSLLSLTESTETGESGGGGGPVSWRLTLDQDLIETLKSSFPSWFPGEASAASSIASSPSSTSSRSNTSTSTGSAGVDVKSPSPSCSSTSSSSSYPSSSSSASCQEVSGLESLGLLLASKSPVTEQSNSSSSGVSSNESCGGTPTLSFRSSSISSSNSFPPSPPSLVIYATQIEQPPGQRAAFRQILADMAEGVCVHLDAKKNDI